jgi:outer membrane immunogenic protein
MAADMATKAPLPAPTPAFSWTGWYVGVNAGASFGRAKTDFNGAPGFSTNATLATEAPPGFVGTDTADPSGFIGGGQIGYNWQWSPIIVLGIEADFQGALEKDSITLSSNFTAPASNGGTPLFGSNVVDYSAKIEWFGTVRGRIGYVWGNGNVMSYLTGGLAYGKVDVAGTSTLIANNLAAGVPPVTQAFDHSKTNTGWVAGYGTEGVIDFLGAHNWTWRIEGLYMDLGHLDTTGPGASFAAGPNVLTAGPAHTHTHFTDGILRGGLNYKFF